MLRCTAAATALQVGIIATLNWLNGWQFEFNEPQPPRDALIPTRTKHTLRSFPPIQ